MAITTKTFKFSIFLLNGDCFRDHMQRCTEFLKYHQNQGIFNRSANYWIQQRCGSSGGCYAFAVKTSSAMTKYCNEHRQGEACFAQICLHRYTYLVSDLLRGIFLSFLLSFFNFFKLVVTIYQHH